MKTESLENQKNIHIPRSYWIGPIWSELLLALLPLLFFLCIYHQLPEKFATHWGIDGMPDGYSGKKSSHLWYFMILLGIFILIIMKAARGLSIFLLSRSGERLDQNNLKLASRVMTYAEFACIIISSFTIIFVLKMALEPSGIVLNIDSLEKISFAIMSIFLILVGNLCPKIRPNKWLGIRTPYAFSNEEAWTQTQRFGGKLLVWTGILNLCVTLAPFPFLSLFFVATLILATVIMFIWKPGNKKTQQQP